MRAGLPVIASDVGGVGEAVQHGVTGWLTPAGQDEPLQDALMSLLPDKNKLYEMGLSGRRRFIEKFTFLQMAQKTLSVYQSVLEESGN
jgi:glycosyltransferase involved in cell wall biosynthesis